MDNMTVLLKEIDLIESCIARMGNKSSSVKNWSIVIFVAIIGLLPERLDAFFVALSGLVVSFSFWFMNARYLQLSRLFRLKYQWVIRYREESDEFRFDLSPENEKMREGTKPSSRFCKAFLSWSVMHIYIPQIAFYLIWLLYSKTPICTALLKAG